MNSIIKEKMKERNSDMETNITSKTRIEFGKEFERSGKGLSKNVSLK
jgi:hypothetical protein